MTPASLAVFRTSCWIVFFKSPRPLREGVRGRGKLQRTPS